LILFKTQKTLKGRRATTLATRSAHA